MKEKFSEDKYAYAHHIATLVAGYIRDTLTPAEHAELDEWVSKSDENMQLFEELTDERKLQEELTYMEEIDIESALKKIHQRIHFKDGRVKRIAARPGIYAIAASFLLMALLMFFIYKGKKQREEVGHLQISDVAPGGKHAILTLSNGAAILLDQAKSGLVYEEGNSKVMKPVNGRLVYNSRDVGLPVMYNTITTPRGGEYEVTLSDGTRIWMNASSSLRFPTVFNNIERNVELTGEAYFEVASLTSGNAKGKVPFIVHVNGMQIEVLGTHFNVMAYTDENDMQTTLVEGSVKVSKGMSACLLAPGERAILDRSGKLSVEKGLDPEETLAWKNGFFQFTNEEIQPIMREVARWYDVEVDIQGNIGQHFNITVPRNVPVSKILKLLELTGRLHFTIEDKPAGGGAAKIILRP